MSDHYIIVADRGHLRIFRQRQDPGQSQPALDEVFAEDFISAKHSYTDRASDMAGRFQSSKQQGRGRGAPTARTGMSIDERLPAQREEDRRRMVDVAAGIAGFLREHPDVTWDLSAATAICNELVESLTQQQRDRLRKTLHKDLVNMPAAELIQHFV